MKNIESKILKKELKKVSRSFLVAVVFALLTAIFIGIGYYNSTKGTYLNDVIAKKQGENINTYLKVESVPYPFAEYDDEPNNAFYIIYDGEYYYVAYMNEKEAEKITEEQLKDGEYKIYGISKKPGNDVKKLAIDTYNEGLKDEEKVTMSNYDSVFGNVYIDTTTINGVSTICYVLALICWITFMVCLILFIVREIRTQHALKKMSEEDFAKLQAELEDKDTFHYEKLQLAITKNYIVSFRGTIKVFNFKDIVWSYETRIRQNGFTTARGLIIVTFENNKFKKYNIASVDNVTKKSKLMLEELEETIATKNPKILIGYTKENKNKLKEEYGVKHI